MDSSELRYVEESAGSPQQRIARIVHGEESCELPIFGPAGQVLGTLRPLTVRDLGDGALMQRLSDWRNRARESFLTQFVARAETTERWLRDTVLTDYTRLLWLISARQRLIGQLGFIHLTSSGAELDNLLRGEPGGHPQLMVFAESCLLGWLFHELGLQEVTARVFTDNQLAISLHESLGFCEDGARTPLVRRRSGEQIAYVPSDAPSADRYLCRLRITRDRFLLRKELAG